MFQCALYQPCYGQCLNTAPGYQCYACPEGFSGTYEDAYAWNFHTRVFMYMNTNYSAFPNQTCDDVDECAINNGGCGTGVTCVNTMVSYNTKSKWPSD